MTIKHHCTSYKSACLGDDVFVDDYCRVGSETIIGNASRIVYGAQIYDEVSIGRGCIIGGFIPNRVTIEDDVTSFATFAHTYLDATIPWGTLDEPSAVVRKGSVIGMGCTIIGPVTIDPRSYVAAGETVRESLAPRPLAARRKGRTHPNFAVDTSL